MTAIALRLGVALAAALPAGCAATGPPAEADPAANRAALALIEVDNRTADTLVVSFRPAAGAANDVIIGRAPPGRRTLLAPVPAAEPILLSARAGAAGRIELPVRSFAIDERWTWVIE